MDGDDFGGDVAWLMSSLALGRVEAELIVASVYDDAADDPRRLSDLEIEARLGVWRRRRMRRQA